MGETRQPNTLYLAFVFFFTLAIATRTTTGSVNCRSLSYPTGYWIEFNCSEYGTAKIGEFHVDEVTDANIYVNIPPMCEREIGKIEQLFRENLAPSNLNTILARGCNESSINCVISPTLFRDQSNLGRCMSPVSCLNGATTTTTDVMSVGDVVNGSGCNKYWLSSILTESSTTTSEVSYNLGRLKLDWWLEEGCSDTTCSKNANCTQVNLPDSRLGHRCTCLDGFDGDAYGVYGGDPEIYLNRFKNN